MESADSLNATLAAHAQTNTLRTAVATAAAMHRVLGNGGATVRVGRYVLGPRVGEGGMGVVHRAHDPALDRDVALKLVPIERERSPKIEAAARLEAQAQARVSHPTIVPVYDTGIGEVVSSLDTTRWGPFLYIVMELVPGVDLAQWLKSAAPPRSDILRVVAEAGAGLAAAHDAGVVHRDFKPTNVMVQPDGRARVLDFGLARAAGTASERAGAKIMGTPIYMAPEQHRGDAPNPAVDQYALALVFVRALSGAHPFGGTPLRGLYPAKHNGPPSLPGVPPKLAAALARGLEPNPRDRYPGVRELIAAVKRADRRRRVLPFAVVGCLPLLAVGFTEEDTTCEAGVGAAWDAERVLAVRTALLDSDPERGVQVWARVEQRAEAYAAQLVRSQHAACGASGSTATATCLASARSRFDAATNGLATVDAQSLDRAHTLLSGLPRLDPCQTPKQPRPHDAALAVEVEAIRRDLETALAAVRLGHVEIATRRAHAAMTAAGRHEYAPLVVEAQHVRGVVAMEAGDHSAARRDFEDAAASAWGIRHDDVAARAAAKAVSLIGFWEQDLDAAQPWLRLGRAAIERMGGNPRAEAMLAFAHARVLLRSERYAEAAEVLSGSLEVYPDATNHQRAAIYGALAQAKRLGSDPDAALDFATRARDAIEQAVGSDHTDYASALVTLAQTQVGKNAEEDAIANLRRAEEIYTRRPRFRRQLAITQRTLGTVFGELERVDEARVAFEESLRLFRETVSADHPDLADAFENAAVASERAGHLREAEQRYNAALVIWEAKHGADHLALARSLRGLGRVRAARGRRGAAEVALQRALAIARAASNVEGIARALVELGDLRLRAGDTEDAAALYAEGLAVGFDVLRARFERGLARAKARR